MSENALSEQEWKKFAKGRNLKDAALLKAMAEFDKAARDPAAQLKALDEIDKQADALRKANKADKEITSYLDGIDKALPKERKLAEAALKAAESEESEEEEEAPDVLTTKLIPLMRTVPRGEVLHALVASLGKDTAVLLSRKPIGPPRRKVLTKFLGATGGVKFFPGECIWEEKAHTFVLQTQAAGLAKKIKAALLAQTEVRFKVRVRGEDGAVDDDGEPPEGQQALAGSAEEAEGAETETSETANEIDKAPALDAALDSWRSARNAAVTTLKALAKEAAEARDAESAKAVIEVMAVVKQLTVEPRTAQQVAELARWLQQDEVVIDVCNMEQDIRTPLLKALAAVRASVLPA